MVVKIIISKFEIVNVQVRLLCHLNYIKREVSEIKDKNVKACRKKRCCKLLRINGNRAT